jgi:hypothetical protein
MYWLVRVAVVLRSKMHDSIHAKIPTPFCLPVQKAPFHPNKVVSLGAVL